MPSFVGAELRETITKNRKVIASFIFLMKEGIESYVEIK